LNLLFIHLPGRLVPAIRRVKLASHDDRTSQKRPEMPLSHREKIEEAKKRALQSNRNDSKGMRGCQRSKFKKSGRWSVNTICQYLKTVTFWIAEAG
jgi:hypothetical protein